MLARKYIQPTLLIMSNSKKNKVIDVIKMIT